MAAIKKASTAVILGFISIVTSMDMYRRDTHQTERIVEVHDSHIRHIWKYWLNRCDECGLLARVEDPLAISNSNEWAHLCNEDNYDNGND